MGPPAQRPVEGVALRIPDRAEQDGIGTAGELKRLLGQRMPARTIARRAHRRFLIIQTARSGGVQYTHGFGDNLWTDAISGKQRDLRH